MNNPYLEITEQPINQFHFRYESEMKEPHGFLTGQKEKSFPTVCLRNFNGTATIRCSLYQMPEIGEEPYPHSHSLVVRKVVRDKIEYPKDPHDVTVSPKVGYQAIFKGMRIQNTKKNDVEAELFEKFVTKWEFESGQALTPDKKDDVRKLAQNCKEKMNFNQVVLCFEAYTHFNGRVVYLCKPVFSTPINEKRCAKLGELEISCVSRDDGFASGNEKMFLFVKKVDKKNINVRFYEQNDNGEVVWKEEIKSNDLYVHYQYAIALETPPYRDTNIKESVEVFVQLYRDSGDHATSEPIEFQYMPCQTNNGDGNRKRQRTYSSCNDSDTSEVVEQSAHNGSQCNGHAPQNLDIEEVLTLMPELRNGVVDEEVKKLTAWILNYRKKLKNNESEMLVTDSASNETHDGDNSQDLQKTVNEFIRRFLEIPLLKSCNDDEHEFRIAYKLCAYIFERITFNGRNTIVHLGVKSNDSALIERLLEILHKYKLDELLNLQNYNQETCVHLACAMDNANILKKMMEYGADVNRLDWNGNTALHVAIKNGHNDCVSALLNTTSTVDLSVFNDSGYTPLHLAAMKNNLKVVEMLTHKAIQTQCLSIFDDMDGDHGHNALQIAIQSNANDVAEYLIKNNCISPSKMNRSGHTALQLARNVNAMHLVNLMEQHTMENDENLMNNKDDYDGNECDVDANEENCCELEDKSKDKYTIEQETTIETAASFADTGKITKSDNETFDDKCYAELSIILNANDKWKLAANELGYKGYVENWKMSSNPAKVLLKFTEALRVPKDKLIEIFHKFDEKRAIECIYEWNRR